MSQLTVVMPAHDEAGIIRSALAAILSAPADAIDVVVVANGCTDDTAARATDLSAAVRVISIDEASKIAALNAGSQAVETYPVAYVDADVEVSGTDLLTLAERLAADDRCQVASPRMVVRASPSFWVRQYYRAWALTDYRSSGHIGSGVYMLTRAGRERFKDFPPVIADDLYVQRLFAVAERLTPDDLCFHVAAPGTLSSLVKRNTRIAAGNLELAEVFPDLAPPSGRVGVRGLLARVWARPSSWLGLLVYSTVYATVQRRARVLRASAKSIAWSRDETSRGRT